MLVYSNPRGLNCTERWVSPVQVNSTQLSVPRQVELRTVAESSKINARYDDDEDNSGKQRSDGRDLPLGIHREKQKYPKVLLNMAKGDRQKDEDGWWRGV